MEFKLFHKNYNTISLVTRYLLDDIFMELKAIIDIWQRRNSIQYIELNSIKNEIKLILGHSMRIVVFKKKTGIQNYISKKRVDKIINLLIKDGIIAIKIKNDIQNQLIFLKFCNNYCKV